MKVSHYLIADENFNRARFSEMLERIGNILKPEDHELLSLQDVKKALQLEGESYQGYTTVPIDRIIGSEGRYKDFSRTYLPRRESSRKRWTSIDRAHQQSVELPAVNLYEIAGYYFVRDGNHRVSVARSMGMQDIDAIVIRLDTKIKLDGATTRSALKEQIIVFEHDQFYNHKDIAHALADVDIQFTETGRYDELYAHLHGHLHCLQEYERRSVSFAEAVRSWKNTIFLPITRIIGEEKALARFPGRTVADMYMWIIRHREVLQKKDGGSMSFEEAVADYSKRYGKNRMQRIVSILNRLRSIIFTR